MENELSIKISANMQEVANALDKIIPKLNQFDNAISKILNNLDKNGSIKNFNTNLNELGSNLDKVTNKGNNLKKALTLGATFAIAQRAFRTGLKWMQHSIDYSEALNLFNVVLDESIEKGMRFQNVMNEAFGTNQAETLTRQGLYQSMAENMGIAQEYAYIMSETSTKLVNDISSLYNKDENTVAEALRAGIYAGQTKPLRSFGMDITESSLQPILNDLNIRNEDGTMRTVRELSQAEKQIVRYIAVLRQSSEAHGDWANTIEAPANQLKIFKNQLVEAQRALANLFIGTFGKILPYANAILMVIKEVANAIGGFLGIKATDYNSGAISTLTDDFDDLGAGVDDATGKIKELKKQTLGFDQINNIDTSKNTGSGSGSASIGGIDQRLLDAIDSYDNGMNKIRMKANEIRDKIMEWLGFTKEIDPLTGKVSWKYNGIKTTLKNMWNSFKGLSTTGKILVGLGLVAGATKLYNIGKKIFNLLGGNGIVKTTKSLLSPLSSLIGYMKTYTSLAGGAGLTGIKKLTAGIKEGTIAWGNQLTAIEKLKVGLVGSTGLLISLGYINEAFDDISRNGLNWSNGLQAVASGMGSIASGAMVGTAILPGWGTAIGACVGAVGALVSALQGYKTEGELYLEYLDQEIEASKKEKEAMEEIYGQIDKNRDANLKLVDSHEDLLNELKQLTDANGYVKEGYEDRVNFILGELNSAYGTEYSLIDGQIQQYGELCNSIELLIAKKRLEIALQAGEEKYNEAKKVQGEHLQKLAEKQEEYNQKYAELKPLEEEHNKRQDEIYKVQEKIRELKQKNGSLTDEEITKLANLEMTLSNLRSQMMTNDKEYQNTRIELEKIGYSLAHLKDTVAQDTSAIIDYENLMAVSTSNSYDEINDAVNNSTEVLKGTLTERLNQGKLYYDSYLEQQKKKNGEITEKDEIFAKSLLNSTINLLKQQTNSVKNITDEQVEAWGTLATMDEQAFINNFKQLNGDIQTQVVDKMQSKGYNISNELQKGINQINPTINVKTNTSDVDSAINTIKNKFSGIGATLGGLVGLIGKADGGIYTNGKWHSINQYAHGGLPTTGEMFVAREKGPELVGSIGNKTAVMNNGQIVSSVASGVYDAVVSAMSQVNLGGQDIRVYAEEGIIVEKAVKGIQQHVNRTGELPFSVPI